MKSTYKKHFIKKDIEKYCSQYTPKEKDSYYSYIVIHYGDNYTIDFFNMTGAGFITEVVVPLYGVYYKRKDAKIAQSIEEVILDDAKHRGLI